MNITSKFSKMYWLKQATGIIAGVFFAIICFHVSIMDNGKLNFQYLPCWIGIIIVIGLIIEIFSILTLQTINVTEKEIILKRLFFNKSKILQYDNILNIQRFKTQMFVKSGPVSDGYHSSILNLEDGKDVIISPDEYENYTDIIYAIRININIDTKRNGNS